MKALAETFGITQARDYIMLSKKQALQLVQDTVDFYSADLSRRAVEGHRCVYLTEGRGCAVGRLIYKQDLKHLGECNQGTTVMTLVRQRPKMRLRGFKVPLGKLCETEIGLLMKLQSFHDTLTNWEQPALKNMHLEINAWVRGNFK